MRRVGAVEIPAGLRAAAKFAIEYAKEGFSFCFDASGAWGLRFASNINDSLDCITYENGSEADAVGGWIRCENSYKDRSAQALKTIFSHFYACEIFVQVDRYMNDKNIIFKVANLDDGRALFCIMTYTYEIYTPEKMAEFVATFDREEIAPVPVEAVAKYPGEPVAAMSAPKCEDNSENSAEDGEKTEASAENCKNSTKNSLRIDKNADFGTVEIYFSSKPSQVVREALKTAHFRWHAVKKCWYGKQENAQNVMTTSNEARAVLHAISGAFKAENVAGGAGIPQDEKTPAEGTEGAKSEKAPEPVEGGRGHILPGGVRRHLRGPG